MCILGKKKWIEFAVYLRAWNTYYEWYIQNLEMFADKTFAENATLFKAIFPKHKIHK